jgi:hypothetical protein
MNMNSMNEINILNSLFLTKQYCIFTYRLQVRANSFHQVNHFRKFFLNIKQVDGDYTEVICFFYIKTIV